MIPDGVKERLLSYQKWVNSFLIKEFINLPVRYQASFINFFEETLNKFREIHKEAFNIKERMIVIQIEDVKKNEIETTVSGFSKGVLGQIQIRYPKGSKVPSCGKNGIHTVYSLNGIEWYSTKSELIKRGVDHV